MSWRKNCKQTVASRLEAVLANDFPDIPHDVIFNFGDDKNKKPISCHKLFLAVVSPVFEAMFSDRHSGDLQSVKLSNNQGNRSGNSTVAMKITVPDVDPQGLKNLVQYAYTGKFNIEVKDALVTMYAAHKYDIPELTEHCSQMLHSNLNLENVLTIYKAAILLNNITLKNKTWQFIQQNSGAFLDSKQFLQFSKNNLRDFLKMRNINGKSELDVFNAAIEWANHQCDQKGKQRTSENIKELLGNNISLIRFPIMSADEFSEFVEPSGVLSAEECSLMYKYFSVSSEKRAALSSKIIYSCQMRVRIFDAVFSTPPVPNIPQQSRSECSLYSYGGSVLQSDRFLISACAENVQIKLKAVGVILPNIFCSKDTQIKISLIAPGASAQFPAATTTKAITKCIEICYIEFDSPAIINPNVSYELQVSQLNKGKVECSNLRSMTVNSNTQKTFSPIDKKFDVRYAPAYGIIWALRFYY